MLDLENMQYNIYKQYNIYSIYIVQYINKKYDVPTYIHRVRNYKIFTIQSTKDLLLNIWKIFNRFDNSIFLQQQILYKNFFKKILI